MSRIRASDHSVAPSEGSTSTLAWSGAGVSWHRASPWVLYGLAVVVHAVMGAFIAAPTIHADEGGYLLNARQLVTGDPIPAHNFSPGYSVLLVPLFWITSDPESIYRGTLLINALVLGSVAPLSWALVGRLATRMTTRMRIGVSAVVALYPPFVLYSDLAVAETLFIPLFAGLTLLASHAFDGRRPLTWAVLGTGTVYLMIVHPRGLAVVAALVMVAALFFVRRRDVLSAVGLASGLAVGAGIHLLLRIGTVETAAPTRTAATVVERSVGTWDQLVTIVVTGAGQFFYLSVASAGLVPIALAVTIASLVPLLRNRSTSATDYLFVFLTAAFAGVFLLSTVFLSQGGRTDHMIYGRYNEGVLVPLLVVGLLVATRSLKARALSLVGSFGVATAAIALSGVVLWLGRSGEELSRTINWANVLTLYPLLRWLERVDVAIVAGVGVAVCALALVLLRPQHSRISGLAMLAATYAAISFYGWATYQVHDSRETARNRVLSDLVTRVDHELDIDVFCVGYDTVDRSDWHLFNYAFFLGDIRLERFSSARQQPCGDLVISGSDEVSARFPGARTVAHENNVEQTLWALSGETADRLRAAGWTLPTRTDAALPPQAYRSVIDVTEAQPIRIAHDQPRTVRLELTHAGAGSPWIGGHAPSMRGHSIQIGVRWYTGDRQVGESRSRLPRPLMPGDQVTVRVELGGLLDGSALPPGDYEAVFSLVHEGIGWFDTFGDNTITVPVTVSGAR